MLEIRGWTKDAEVDDYENGCLAEGCVCFSGDDSFAANNVEKLIEKLCDFTDSKRDYVTICPCDEQNRIDIEKMENGDGYTPSESEIEDWKQGKIKLWAARYTFFVEEVERKEANLIKTK